ALFIKATPAKKRCRQLDFPGVIYDNFSWLFAWGNQMTNPYHDPTQMLQLLTNICSAFSERLDRKTLIARILEYAIELGNAERGTIFLAPESSESSRKEELKSLIA